MDSITHAQLFLEELYHHTQNNKNGITEYCKTMKKRNQEQNQTPNKGYNGQGLSNHFGKIQKNNSVETKNYNQDNEPKLLDLKSEVSSLKSEVSSLKSELGYLMKNSPLNTSLKDEIILLKNSNRTQESLIDSLMSLMKLMTSGNLNLQKEIKVLKKQISDQGFFIDFEENNQDQNHLPNDESCSSALENFEQKSSKVPKIIKRKKNGAISKH